MRWLLTAAPLALLLAGCEDARTLEQSSGSTTPAYERVENATLPMEALTQPVRIGESGAGFAACASRGTTRRVVGEDEALEVRAAPFEAARSVADLPAGSHFFVCSRSLDQKWFGVVFDEAGAASPACGVSRPVASRRAYEGPCRSGWVASIYVKLTAS